MFKSVFTNILDPESRQIVVTTAGEKDRQNYKPMWTDNGTYDLVPDGKIHSYEETQAWKATCDMSAIMERYLRTGDSSILNQRAGFFGDVTNIPTNYADLANTLKNADMLFNSLPKELKAEYDNSPAKFFANNDDIGGVINAFFGKVAEAPKIPAAEIPSPGPVEGAPVAPALETLTNIGGTE